MNWGAGPASAYGAALNWRVGENTGDVNDLVDRTQRPYQPSSDAIVDEWKRWVGTLPRGKKQFCPYCGERLEQAGAPFWNPEPLYHTNEARVKEAEDESDNP